MSFFTTTGTITTPQQSGTDYYFVTFNNNGTITFNSSVSPISYLVVGGGGGGGAGTFVPGLSDSFSSTAYSYSGGGGASGDIVSGTFNPLINQIINIVVGTGGSGGTYNNNIPSGGSNGGQTSINNIYIANGGNGGSPGITDQSVFATPSTVSAPGGINSTFGSGGSGVAENYSIAHQSPSTNQILSQTTQNNATSNPSYQNYILNSYSLGNFGGGGGGGGSGSGYSDVDISPSNPAGAGGSGADSTKNATNGKNGGGGGGSNAFVNNIGGKGGDGIVILSFKDPIVTNYKIPGGQDLSEIFFPLSSGGVTGSTGTGYNYNTGSGFQDLKDLFALYTPGSTAAPQTFYKTAYYGGQDLNLVFQNINYPPLYKIIDSFNITINYVIGNGYYGLIFQTNGPKNSYNNPTSGQNGTATIQFTQSISNVNILVVGGGGGGACGYVETGIESYGGGGGGGGGITFITGANIDTSEVSIIVGCAGHGNPGTNATFEPAAGAPGNSSIISYNNNISYTSGGGSQGYGYGAVSTGGGNGGSTTQTGGIDTYGGGGGGGGGGGTSSGSGNIYIGGSGGSAAGSGHPGISGNAASGSGTTNQGQNGGASWNQNITIPFYGPQPGTNITLGGGGGGGGGGGDYSEPGGGGAGVGSGGIGNSSPIKNGESANNSITGSNPGYGGGGGGGGIYNPSYLATGGDGGNGVVIIYWPV